MDEKKEQKRQENSNIIRGDGPVDLMSDLVSKLRARRDGISGSIVGADEKETADSLQIGGAGGLLGKVSSMIASRGKESELSDSDDRGSEGFNEDDWK